jgi:hypothetical protein
MSRFIKMLPLLVMVLSFTAIGCDDDDDNNVTAPPMTGSAMIRVVHASPDAPAVDIYVEGIAAPIYTDVAYGETTAYMEVEEGTYNIQIRAAGAPASSAPVYETGDLAIADEAKITAVAAGLLSAGKALEGFRVLPLFEEFEMPGAASARVRIVHASADAPTVAIDVGNDGTPEIDALAPFADTGAAGVDLPAGTALQIGIWAGQPLARVTAFTTPELPADTELFVIATGLVGSLAREADGFSLLAVGPSGSIGFIKQNPILYAFHASPDAPSVDIAVSGSPDALVSDLAFGELSQSLQVPPGSYDLDFRAASSGATAATITTPSLAPGERYLAVATGFLVRMGAAEAFQLAAFRDGFGLEGDDPLVRAIHASPDAPAVDIGVVSGDEFDVLAPFAGLAFPNASAEAGAAVPVASLDLGIAPAGSGTPIVQFPVTTATGIRAFAIAAGALSPEAGEEAFRLFIIDTAPASWTAAEIMN